MNIESYTISFKKPRSGRLRHISITLPVKDDECGEILASQRIKTSHMGHELLLQGYREYGVSKGALTYKRR